MEGGAFTETSGLGEPANTSPKERIGVCCGARFLLGNPE